VSHHYDWKYCNVSEMLGVVMSNVYKFDYDSNDAIAFEAVDGREWRMYHPQGCCESVHIESIAGDLADLVGSPLTMSEEAESPVPADHQVDPESETWTFYRFATVRGYVNVRWYGTSNGYYSESVSFALVQEEA
jgi:hypothetical protein